MPWNKMFVKARIEKKNDNAFMLRITYSWYGLMEFDEVFLEASLEDAKKRLLIERSHDHVNYFDSDGKELSLH